MIPQVMHPQANLGQMTEGATHSFPVAAFPPVMYMPQPDENFLFQNQQLLQNSMSFPQMPPVTNPAPVQVAAHSPEIVSQTPLQNEGQLQTENDDAVIGEQRSSSLPQQMQLPTQIQPAQFVQPLVFPQMPMAQQQIPQFVPCVVPGAPFQPAAFQPMVFVQPNTAMFNHPEQHPIMRSDSSHSRHESFDGSEYSDLKSNSLRRFSSDQSRDGYGSDFWDNRSRIGSEQQDDDEPEEERKTYDGSRSHSQGDYNKRYYKPRENQYRGRERSSSRSGSQKRPTSRERQEEMYKTALCSAWVNQKKCRWGHRCIFAHGLEELRTAKRKQARQKMRPALKKYVTAMLNKLTETNYEEITTEFLTVCVEEVGEHNLTTHGNAIMKSFFNKAVAERELRPGLATCLSKLFKIHPNKDFFKESMSGACYSEYCKPRNKTYALGTMEWISMLVTKDLINDQIVHRILEQMKDARPEQLKVELWCKMLELMGNKIDSTEYFENLSNFKTISTRVRYMIMDLEDLKKNNWVARV
jgi:hypothetical protein